MSKAYFILTSIAISLFLSCKSDNKLTNVDTVSVHESITNINSDTSQQIISHPIIDEDSISFYYWKSNAIYTDIVDSVFKNHNVKDVYLHYFDIESGDDGILPNFVISIVDAEFYNSGHVIPVVFITNKTIKDIDNIEWLAEKIKKLINQISQYHFGTGIKNIQIDCDWTRSTKTKYFKLLELLKKDFNVTATIRLHQIKFKDKTGIPPVDQGVLMAYNIGNLKNNKQNSILEANIVKLYINKNTEYPLKLKLALPLFSQIVIKNNDNHFKLANGYNIDAIYNDKEHFSKITKTLYSVKKDTLFKGFYLSPGYQIKIEKPTEEEIIASYEIVKNSKLDISDLIFYHLDDKVVKSIDINKIIKEISK